GIMKQLRPAGADDWPSAAGYMRQATGTHEAEDLRMLAIVAAVIFAVAFIIRVTSTATDLVLAPISLLLAGLACLALHQAGVGTGWSYPRRRRRR
ncbi:MAG TPA: hypothetical protein VK162_06690, partial [Streptosporangiaceae bacterium]|nr:hypothetical protein [Streptosporangiaceae bacterium]